MSCAPSRINRSSSHACSCFLEDPARPRIAVVLPTGHALGSGPARALDPYGGPHHASVTHHQASFREAQWFANQGFAVVVVDGRGTPGSPSWERAVRDDFARPVLEDQIIGLHAAAHAFTDLDLEHVAIRGWSFGGYLSALAVIDRPDVFHAAIAGAPVTDWRLYDTGYTERYLGVPDETTPSPSPRTSAARCSPAHPSLSRPLQLIHGLADDNVFVAHALQLSRVLDRARTATRGAAAERDHSHGHAGRRGRELCCYFRSTSCVDALWTGARQR